MKLYFSFCMSNSHWDVCSLLSPAHFQTQTGEAVTLQNILLAVVTEKEKSFEASHAGLATTFPSSHCPQLVTWPYPNEEGQEVYLTTCRKGTDLGISVSYKMATSLFAALWCHFTCFSIPSISRKIEVNSRTWFNSGSVILAKGLQRLACVPDIASHQGHRVITVADYSSNSHCPPASHRIYAYAKTMRERQEWERLSLRNCSYDYEVWQVQNL